MSTQNKLLGQHWLYDAQILNEVADAAGVVSDDTVLEVGPGLGTLTAQLLARGAHVIAVEKDQQLAKQLVGKHENLTITTADIMNYDLSTLPKGYKVAANIPYYLTSNLIRKLLESSNQPRQIGLLIQKEVAQRIVAKPGDMSVLAFSVQYFAEIELGSIVPAALFDPPPKVDSQIISIMPHQQPAFPADQKLLFQLIKAGFGEKRKKLINSLAGGLGKDKAAVSEWLQKAKIDQNVRAQELTLQNWKNLYNIYTLNEH